MKETNKENSITTYINTSFQAIRNISYSFFKHFIQKHTTFHRLG